MVSDEGVTTVAFQRVPWWPDMVVAAAKCGGCRVDWCRRDRRRRLGLGFWLCEGERERVMRWHVLIGDLS